MKQVIAVILGGVLSCVAALYAAEDKDVVVTPHGFAFFQIGQIQHITPSFQDGAGVVPKRWDQQRVNMRLTLDAVINERLRIIVGGETEMQANVTNATKNKIFLDCKEAQGIYSWGEDLSRPFLQFAAGYFPYKYNPDASNLGEYLFRTGSYPQWIITDFANAKMRLMGARISSYAIENLSADALFTSAYNDMPVMDYSLSFLAGYRLFNSLFDIGAGVMFDRLVPVDDKHATFKDYPVMDQKGNYVIEGGDSTYNPTTNTWNKVGGDTLYYTIRGTKLAARAAIDFKKLLPDGSPLVEFMGKKGLRFYGEAALLGMKNYLSGDTATFYSDRLKRIPIMFGFNAPTQLVSESIGSISGDFFPIVSNVIRWLEWDLLSVEFEYFNTDRRYKADFPNKIAKPVPDQYMPATAKRTMWKWSVHAEKEFTKGLSLLALVGRDHYRGLDEGGNYYPYETMNGPGDWHYNVRLMYSF